MPMLPVAVQAPVALAVAELVFDEVSVATIVVVVPLGVV